MINYNICSFKSQDNKFDQKNLEHRVHGEMCPPRHSKDTNDKLQYLQF